MAARRFTHAQKIKERYTGIPAANGVLGAFIDERCEVAEVCQVATAGLFNAYQNGASRVEKRRSRRKHSVCDWKNGVFWLDVVRSGDFGRGLRF